MNNIEPNSRFANFCPDLKDELILNALAKYPSSMVKEVAEATGLKEITCRYHLTTLEHAGLIRSEKRRKYLHYFIEPALERGLKMSPRGPFVGISEAVSIAAVYNATCGTDFPERETGRYYGKCPLHEGSNPADLTLYYDSNNSHCWEEAVSRSPVDVAQKALGLPIKQEAIDWLIETFDLPELSTEDLEQQQYLETGQYYLEVASSETLPHDFVQRLQNRGFSTEDTESWQLGYHKQGLHIG